MKKFFALFLVIGLVTLIFASCGEAGQTETSGTTGSSTASGTSSTSGTTATTETTRAFDDQQLVDSLDYDYVIRTVLDENRQIIGVAVSDWKKSTESITVDSEYVLDGVTYPVIQVGTGQGVLTFRSQLKSVTIPGSVLKIAKSAFSYCPELKVLNLSEGLEEIGEAAFWACNKLESLSIPSTVKTIGASGDDRQAARHHPEP